MIQILVAIVGLYGAMPTSEMSYLLAIFCLVQSLLGIIGGSALLLKKRRGLVALQLFWLCALLLVLTITHQSFQDLPYGDTLPKGFQFQTGTLLFMAAIIFLNTRIKKYV